MKKLLLTLMTLFAVAFVFADAPPSYTVCSTFNVTNAWSDNITNGTVTIALNSTNFNFSGLDASGYNIRIYKGACGATSNPLYFALADGSADKQFYWSNSTQTATVKVQYNETVASGSTVQLAVFGTTNFTRSAYDNPNVTFYAYDDWNSFDTNRWQNPRGTYTVSGGILTINGVATYRGEVATKYPTLTELQPLIVITNQSKTSSSDNNYVWLYADAGQNSGCYYQPYNSSGGFSLEAVGTTYVAIYKNHTSPSCTVQAMQNNSAGATNVYKTYVFNYTPYGLLNVTQATVKAANGSLPAGMVKGGGYVAMTNRENNYGGSNYKMDWIEVGTHPNAWTVTYSPTPASSTCTYGGSGAWAVAGSDACVISSNTVLYTNTSAQTAYNGVSTTTPNSSVWGTITGGWVYGYMFNASYTGIVDTAQYYINSSANAGPFNVSIMNSTAVPAPDKVQGNQVKVTSAALGYNNVSGLNASIVAGNTYWVIFDGQANTSATSYVPAGIFNASLGNIWITNAAACALNSCSWQTPGMGSVATLNIKLYGKQVGSNLTCTGSGSFTVSGAIISGVLFQGYYGCTKKAIAGRIGTW